VADFIGEKDVIAVKQVEVVRSAGGEGACDRVGLGGDAGAREIMRSGKQGDAIAVGVENSQRIVAGAVVIDNDFVGGTGLGEDGINARAQPGTVVVVIY
jgi:hypothetical protein